MRIKIYRADISPLNLTLCCTVPISSSNVREFRMDNSYDDRRWLLQCDNDSRNSIIYHTHYTWNRLPVTHTHLIWAMSHVKALISSPFISGHPNRHPKMWVKIVWVKKANRLKQMNKSWTALMQSTRILDGTIMLEKIILIIRCSFWASVEQLIEKWVDSFEWLNQWSVINEQSNANTHFKRI